MPPRSTLGKGSSSWGHKPREDGDCRGRATPWSPPRSRVTVIRRLGEPPPRCRERKIGGKKVHRAQPNPFFSPPHSVAPGSPCRASWCPLVLRSAHLPPRPLPAAGRRGAVENPPPTPQNEDGWCWRHPKPRSASFCTSSRVSPPERGLSSQERARGKPREPSIC